jgi:hypothetical protein
MKLPNPPNFHSLNPNLPRGIRRQGGYCSAIRKAPLQLKIITVLVMGGLAAGVGFGSFYKPWPERGEIRLSEILDEARNLWPLPEGSGFQSVIYDSFGNRNLSEQQMKLVLALHEMGDDAVPILLRELLSKDSPPRKLLMRLADHWPLPWTITVAEERRERARRALGELVGPPMVRPTHLHPRLPVETRLSSGKKKEIVAAINQMVRGEVGSGRARAMLIWLLNYMSEEVGEDPTIMDTLASLPSIEEAIEANDWDGYLVAETVDIVTSRPTFKLLRAESVEFDALKR